MESYNPEQAAAMIGDVSASTVRNWCKWYKPVLGEDANPPLGKERRLSQKDVATLQHVKMLRANRKTTTEIIALLQLATSSNDAAPLTIDVVATPASAQDAPDSTFLLPVVLSTINERIDAMERRLDARERHDWLWTFGMGVWVGLITMGAIFFAVWIAVNGW